MIFSSTVASSSTFLIFPDALMRVMKSCLTSSDISDAVVSFTL